MARNAKTNKANIDKWNHVNLKSICAAKNIISKIKRQLWDDRKYLKIVYLMMFISKICREPTQLNSKKKKSDFKMDKIPGKTFFQRRQVHEMYKWPST